MMLFGPMMAPTSDWHRTTEVSILVLNSKFLRSRVAKRVFLLFVVCALLPMLTLTALVFVKASRELRSQHDRELQLATKAMALSIFERLTMLDSELEIAALRAGKDAGLPSVSSAHFAEIGLLDGRDVSRRGGTLRADELDHLFAGHTLLRVAPCLSEPAAKCVVMIKAADSDRNAPRFLAGDVSGTYLWDPDKLPADTDLLVLSSDSDTLFTSDPSAQLPSRLSRHDAASGFLEWKSGNTSTQAACRDLFLRPEFLAASWTVIVRQTDHAHVLAMQNFRDTLLLVTVLAMWIVVLFSSIQIRRTMGPLELLGDATQRVADQKFDTRVHITSADEFQELGASFNSMASRLGRQFQTLRAISDIDQAVLASRKLDSIIDTALSRVATVLSADCFAIAIFESGSSGCLADLTLRDCNSNAQLVFGNRMVPPSSVAELQSSRSLGFTLDGHLTPEYLLPLADRGICFAQIFPIVLDGRLFAAFMCGLKNPPPIVWEDCDTGRELADRLTLAFSNMALIDALEQLNWGALSALARTIDAKSEWTAGHSERVTALALRIARAMQLPEHELRVMHRGGLLHDIGKIGTPLEILDKPAKLEPHEMAIMREHVQTGVRILEPVAAFAESLPIVAQHHEWYNGAGYPAGLAGEEISLHARIFAVADCYDALVSDRPYRAGLAKARVVKMLAEKSGTQFDPQVIEVFLRLCTENSDIAGEENSACLIGYTS
jgi:putative nucleotidyltransferase with HDIG domain